MSSPTKLADSAGLFEICKSHFSEPVARVAAEVLYWSQHATYSFKGRRGIYKGDKELAEVIGKHPKTVGRSLLTVCASKGQLADNALFDVDYGPKPKAFWGRTRWLFLTPRGLKLIGDAIELREQKTKDKATKRSKKLQQVAADCSNQLPQNAPTLSQTNTSYKPAEVLSSASTPEKECHQVQEEKLQGGGKRLQSRWNAVCDKHKKPELVWRDQQVRRRLPDLNEVAEQINLRNLSDADVESRLTLLCCQLGPIGEEISEAFAKYNRNGLRLESFVRYGSDLFSLASQRIAKASKAEMIFSAAFNPPPLSEAQKKDAEMELQTNIRGAAVWSMRGGTDHAIESYYQIKPEVHALWKLSPEWKQAAAAECKTNENIGDLQQF